MALRKKIVKLCKMIGGVPGMLTKIDENAPEYYSLNAVVTDEQADVAIHAGLRKERTAEYLAEKSGKSLEDTVRICHELADEGIFSSWKDPEDGKERFYVEIFAPGTLERMMGNAKQVAEHPEIAKAFNAYTASLGSSLASTLPMGASLMRVIPIETAIDGNPQAVSFEKLSYYLDKYTQFSVSDCSCRASRRTSGEGCGHLEKDMCLHIGPSAEYYAETGKAHYVTKEEALALLKRAEDNGLMHSIPNITDPGETNAICNCCPCSCFGLRIGLMYGARDAISSNYRAEIDEEKCVACGQCVDVCPGKALKMGQKLCTKTPLAKEPTLPDINKEAWSEAKWDKDYRTNREETVLTGTSPCKAACPAHIAVQGYLRLAADGRYKDALELIKKENPFPAVCGRICDHRCEKECTRGNVDEAVAIDEVKKFIADMDLNEKTRFIPPMINQTGKPYDEKIAIIGAGPAGMSAAFYLAQKGYRPVIFEKSSQPGGMLVNGIPSFRLEKNVVNAEIEILKQMGAEFRLGVEVGKDITIEDLRKEGFKGFYLAIGAQGGRSLGIEGENAEGVLAGVSFLRDVNEGREVKLSGDTVVIGGGNVAVDVARTAVRVCDGKTSMFCLEKREEMPASADEVEEAEEEDITVNCGWGPKEILTEGGKVKAVVFRKCVSVFDENHKFSPKFDENETMTVECSNVLVSVGQSIEWGKLLAGTGVKLNPNGTVIVDPVTYQTSVRDIFAGGDAVTGPKFAIDAIAAGKEAAISLHRIVHEGQDLLYGRNRRIFRALDKENAVLEEKGFDHVARQIPGYNKALRKTFGDAKIDFTEDQIRKETSRCLGCGATKLDESLCVGCGLCTTKCKFDAIKLVRKYNAWGTAFETLPIAVAKHVVKRTGAVAANALKGKKD